MSPLHEDGGRPALPQDTTGPLRIRDPERPGALRILDSGSPRQRRRYAEAARAWRETLHRELRRAGADVLPLRTDASALLALGRFFHDRAARRARMRR